MDKMVEIKWHDKNAQKMTVHDKNGVVYLTYPALDSQEEIIHGFSTRLGGVSQGIYTSMNLSFTRGDEEKAVRENYDRLAAAIGFCAEDIVTSDQTHTANVRKVTAEDRGKGITGSRDYTDVDGMITDVPGLILATFYADCVPLYFVDPVHRAIGLAHSGWRGTVAGMGACMVRYMQEHFNSRPEELVAAIGPSICVDCYEVSEEVAEQFREGFPEDVLQPGKAPGKYQLDLWKANQSILLRAGIQPEHMAVTNVCTCHNPEYLFSHRASHGQRGNLAAFLMLKESWVPECLTGIKKI